MSLEGRLQDLGIPDIFQIIGLSKRSGILTLIHRAGTARVVFTEGNVVYASSDKKSRFGYALLQKGIITYENLEGALRIQKTTSTKKPLGTIMIEMEIISEDTLENALREHIIDVVKDLLTWDTGTFHFELGGVLENEIVLRGGVSSEFLLLEGARLRDEEMRNSTPAQEWKAEGDPKTSSPVLEAEADSKDVPSTPNTAPPPKSRRDLALLPAMIEEISSPSNSSEIILIILRFASEVMNRAVIFVVREKEVAGLGQFGLSTKNGSADRMIRNVKIPLTEPSCLKQVIETGQTYRGTLDRHPWNEYLIQRLEGGWTQEVFIAPVISDGKVIAILYGDNYPQSEKLGESEGLEAFMKVAGFAFGNAILERKIQASQSKMQGGPVA
jgi:hypothetical protein